MLWKEESTVNLSSSETERIFFQLDTKCSREPPSERTINQWSSISQQNTMTCLWNQATGRPDELTNLDSLDATDVGNDLVPAGPIAHDGDRFPPQINTAVPFRARAR